MPKLALLAVALLPCLAPAAGAAIVVVPLSNTPVLGSSEFEGGTAVNPIFVLSEIASGSTVTDFSFDVTVDTLTPGNGSFLNEAELILFTGTSPTAAGFTDGLAFGFGDTGAPGVAAFAGGADLSEDFVDAGGNPVDAELTPLAGESVYLLLDDSLDDPFGDADAPTLADYLISGTITVTYTPAPEPGPLAAASLAGLCLLRRRRA